MKKFEGKVNGEVFDNEKDFNAAAKKAVKDGGNLSISSKYVYEDETPNGEALEKDDCYEVEDEGKVEEVNEDKHAGYDGGCESCEGLHLNSEKYLLSDDRKPTAFGYPIPYEVANNLKAAANKSEIIGTVKTELDSIDSAILDFNYKSKKLERDIKKLQDELDSTKESVRDLKSRKKYYNGVIDITQGSNYRSEYNIATRRHRSSLFDLLDDLDFWRL